MLQFLARSHTEATQRVLESRQEEYQLNAEEATLSFRSLSEGKACDVAKLRPF